MKLFAKCLMIVLAAAMVLTACQKEEAGQDNTSAGETTTQEGASRPNDAPVDDRTLDEIYADILEGVEAEMPALVTQKVKNSTYSYYFGISKPDGAVEAIVAEPSIGSIPFAITLLRVDSSVDADALAKEIKEKVDPRRWVCVAASYVETSVKGDVILLVLDGDNARGQEIVDAFAKG